MRSLLSAALLASVAAATAATAQNPAGRDSVRVRPESAERTYTFRFGPGGREDHMTLMHRGRLGITVDMSANASRDSVGALVAGVLPGGAADRAGIRAGDVIVRFNGTRLAASTSADSDTDNDASLPATRLLRIASRLDPGDTVMLDVRRDGQPQTFTFQAEESDMDMLVNRMEPMMRGLADGIRGGIEGGIPPMLDLMGQIPGRITVALGGALADVQLVKVNPDLGQYFGTTEGLLVTSVGSDSALGLKAGDVILSIGGRRPLSPAHAMRILSTYEPGETVQLEIMRQRHRTTVSGHVPQARERSWGVRHNSFDMPLMPLMDDGSGVIYIRSPKSLTIET